VNRAVLLDRDGVLNVDRPLAVRSQAELALEAGADRAVALLSRAGYTVLVITNQAVVGRGELAPAELERIHARLAAWMAAAGGRIDRFYVCPHADGAGCTCRKPKPGLIDQARAEWGFAPGETWFVGDAERDIAAGRAAGCKPALVLTGKGREAQAREPAVPTWPTLLAFATELTGATAPARIQP
jgi:D-glycero-D-manno-heptose 1,7-bisphosphate phosphatase